MRNGLRALVGIGASTAVVALVGPGTALAGTLDQQQTNAGGGTYALSNVVSHAQTFTAGVSGGVDQVDLDLATVTTLDPLTVEIRNVAGGAPGTTVLASGSTPSTSAVPLAFVPIHFATPAPVVAGTQYAIVAWTQDTAGGWGWGHSAADSYTGGTAFTLNAPVPPTGTWSSDAVDLAFKTYVAPSTAAITGPTGQRAAALKKCKKKHSHKAKKKCKKKARKLPV
jgi:hypothetical protein